MKIKKIFINIWKILSLVMLVMYFAVPFLNTFFTVKIALYIWILSVISMIVLNIYLNYQEWYEKYMTSQIGFLAHGWLFISLSILGSAFLINYFDTPYNWWWAIAVIAFILSIILPINIFHYNYNKKDHSAAKHYKAHGVPYILDYYKELPQILPYMIFYWIVDAFYITTFTKWFAGQVIFGCLGIIVIFYNLSRTIIAGKVKNAFLLVQDFALGIAGTIYLICIIPDKNIQNVVLVTVSAVYGGLITLVGVAWTIKDSHKQERETKRLEKMPYLQLEACNNMGADFQITLPLDNGDEVVNTFYKVLRLRNLGNGPATNIIYSWNKEKKNIITHYTPINAIQDHECYNVNFVFTEQEFLSSKTAYTLVAEYNDMLGYTYEQRFAFVFGEEEGEDAMISCETSAPEYLGEVYYSLDQETKSIKRTIIKNK